MNSLIRLSEKLLAPALAGALLMQIVLFAALTVLAIIACVVLLRKKAEGTAKTVAAPIEPVASSVATPAASVVHSAGTDINDGKLVAAISAAIGAYRGESNASFDIISIRKI